MSDFPPEKYYEACITYHLVKEFEERFDIKLFPFSISQIEEKSRGYDFGYTYSNQSFFIQYKRPSIYESKKTIYSWQICREQLSVINCQHFSLRTYYALPAFIDTMQWFEGLENTYFVLAPNLENYLKNKANTKTSNINSNIDILKKWDYFLQFYDPIQSNVAYVVNQKGITINDIVNLAKKLDRETRECTWVYLMEDNSYVF
ncbi:hypothetical protein [Clostridium tertium]|uniref:hypothetical protein n=1 Tax=Clostridium tertium TaxID=1559 RepID=UPI000DD01F37|nr:hypothetical protein [Clostridium tertium]